LYVSLSLSVYLVPCSVFLSMHLIRPPSNPFLVQSHKIKMSLERTNLNPLLSFYLDEYGVEFLFPFREMNNVYTQRGGEKRYISFTNPNKHNVICAHSPTSNA
jgi:hypothetical protein